ncbi:MAG TPA: ribose 5-phosphate isomerase B [Clostridia bacterium]|nr:ribose 5-phosphate isomerase B [Clostridia bacterium]
MTIGIGNDHVGYGLKLEIKAYLEQKGYRVTDFGADSPQSADYPVYAEKVANAVVAGDVEAGILICGTGIGISIAANKVKGIRCAACSESYSARMAKQHNNANILAFGARVVGVEVAKMMVDEWLESAYEPRHTARLNMIAALEEKD